MISLAGMIATSIGIFANSIGVFFGPIAEDLNVLRGDVILSHTIWNTTVAFVAFAMAVRYNKNNFKKILSVAVAVTSLSCLIQSFATSIVVVYVCSIVRGFSVAAYGLAVVTSSINFWFKKKASIITSCILAFSGIAGAIFSPVLNSIITSYGWKRGYQMIALLNVIFCLPALLSKYTYKPEYINALPYGIKSETGNNSEEEQSINYLSITFIGCAIVFCLNSCSTFITQQFSGYTTFLQLGTAIGALMVSANMVGNISSKFMFGFVSEKLKVFKSIYLFLSINVIGTALLIFVRSQPLLLSAALLHGFQYAFGATGVVMLVKELYGVNKYPKVYASISLISAIVGSLEQSFLGYVYDISGQYYPIFLIALLAQLITFATLFILQRHTKKAE